MTVAQAARAVDLPRATVRRALLTLVHLGYLRQQGNEFELTPRVLGLATAYLDAAPGSAVLQPACERLCGELGVVCSVAVLDGDTAVMIARSAPNQLLAAGVGVGHRLPVFYTSLGRVLLAALDDAELTRRLAAIPREKRRLRAAVLAARDDGYAYADGETTPGFRSVAVPLTRWDGQVIAAMNVGGTNIGEVELRGRLLQALRQTAKEVSGQLV